ncbi:hypothetical protein ABH926_004926 [Catenulispora sp. GP43]|uniref:hypothetical protein n=1 Tax=Catenulispora sp. GP43 TaxID=3156263 RepID=UPI00351498F7
MRRWGAAWGLAVGLTSGLALAGCSSAGTVGARPSPSGHSSTALPTNQSLASGRQGSPTTSASADATVTQDQAAAALKAYQTQNDAANAALDTAQMAKIESGSLLALDQASLLYAQGVGGDRAKQAKVPMALNNPVFLIPRSPSYPRGFFVTADAVQSGSPNSSFLMHFTQDHAGAPWLADSIVILTPGQQWPAFAVGADGLLDYSATQQDKLPLNTMDLAAADRTMLADDNAGQPGSPFLNDDPTTAEQKWIQGETNDVSPATAALTVSTEPDLAPTYLPLKDGGELALYGTRLSLRISQSGRTFTFGDQGWAKVAGTDTFNGGFTADAVWMVAAIDPPDKAAKIQKIASNGGLVSVR